MQRKSILFVPLLICIVCLVILATAAPALALAQVKVIVHYVEGAFAPEKNAYQVHVFLSVLDSSGKPVRDLNAANFAVTEDSRKLDVADVAVATQPMNIILLLDNSVSMGGSIGQAKQAASNFVSSLTSGDRVAVVSFNEQIHREIEFSDDPGQVRAAIDRIKVAATASGTCLNDATYDAIQLAATEPAGRRAVILLTDGVDELAGSKGTCSSHTVEDVIGAASKGTTRIPIYTIALGSRTDERGLTRMAEMTGGDYLKSPDASQLAQLFSSLSDAVKSQYVLTYISSAAPGPHSVVVEVDAQGVKDLDMRDYILPPLPTSITILSPADAQKIEGDVSIETEVSAQGKIIAQVVFWLDGQEIGFDDTYPYTWELEAGAVPPGKHAVLVQAVGQDNVELARSSVEYEQVASAAKTTAPTTVAAAPVAAAPATAVPTPVPTKAVSNLLLLAGGGAALFIVIIGAVVVVTLVLRRKPPATQPSWSGGGAGLGSLSAQPPLPPAVPDVLATLSVLQSDDPMMVNQVLNITHSVTQLGRGAQNDIIFPKDSPVSRQHAVIEQKGYQFWLSEVCVPDDTGALKRPKYGTYVNDQPLKETPVLLRSGVIIRLGPRVRLEFRLPRKAAEDRTIDGEDVTQDGEGVTLDGVEMKDDGYHLGTATYSDPAKEDRTITSE